MEVSYFTTTIRHGYLVNTFFGRLLSLIESGRLHAFKEQHALVFLGKKYSGEETLFSDINTLSDLYIDLFDFVQPDFLYLVVKVILKRTFQKIR